jgi:hypothetical protein
MRHKLSVFNEIWYVEYQDVHIKFSIIISYIVFPVARAYGPKIKSGLLIKKIPVCSIMIPKTLQYLTKWNHLLRFVFPWQRTGIQLVWNSMLSM